MKNNLVIVTGDSKMIKQCGILNVNCISIDLEKELFEENKRIQQFKLAQHQSNL